MTLWGWDYMILIPNFLRNPSSMNKDYSWTFLFFPEVRAIGIFFRNLWVLVLWSRQLSLTFVVLVQPCWSRTRYYVYIYIKIQGTAFFNNALQDRVCQKFKNQTEKWLEKKHFPPLEHLRNPCPHSGEFEEPLSSFLYTPRQPGQTQG